MSPEGTSFYITGGTLRHDAPCYVERLADRDLFEALRQGEFCYLLTARQLGKSSLMVRTAVRLRDHGINVAVLDLTAIGQNLTPEQWYNSMALRLGQQFGFEDELDRFWHSHEQVGPCERLFKALREVVLPRLQEAGLLTGEDLPGTSVEAPRPQAAPPRSDRLVIFVDEIDTVRSLPFVADEFFAAIRACYNRRTEDPAFDRLTFCLLGVATPSDLIRETRTTPFNIGRRIELHDFTKGEAATLARGMRQIGASDSQPATSPDWTAEQLLTRIFHWTNGHPYLTQRLCRAVAEEKSIGGVSAVDRLCEDLFLASRAQERDDNLLFVRERLLRSETDLTSLLELYLRVRAGRTVADDETSQLVNVLRLSGIVTARHGRLEERNRIYSQVFDANWVRAHLPDADLRRQKAAFQRGVLRTTAIAAVVIAALTVAVLFAVNEARKARRALAQSSFSKAQALRVSGLAGDRRESLRALDEAQRYYTNLAALRDEAIASLALMDLQETTNFLSPVGLTGAFELSPDLGMAAIADREGAITLRRQRDGQIINTLPGSNGPVAQLRFSAGGSRLFICHSANSNHVIAVWDCLQGQRLFVAASGAGTASVDFSADGGKIAIGRVDGRVSVYSLPGGDLLHEWPLTLDSGAPRVAQSLRFSPTGELLAAASLDDYYVEVWNSGATQRVARLYHAGAVPDVSWHPQGELLASACSDGRIYLWMTNDFKKVTGSAQKLTGHEGGVMATTFNRRGTVLASLGRDETVRLWVPATGRQIKGIVTGESFGRLRFSTDNRHLIASGSGRPEVRVWEVSGDELTVLQAPVRQGDALRTIDFSPDGQWLMCASGDRAAVWDASSGTMLGAVPLPNARSAWFDATGRNLIASGGGGFLRWSLVNETATTPPRIKFGPEQRLYQIPPKDGEQPQLEWDARGKESKALYDFGVMVLPMDRSIAVVVRMEDLLLVPMNPSDPQGLRTCRLHAHYPQIAVAPERRWFAGLSAESSQLHLWDLTASNGPSMTAKIPGSKYFTFSPDSRWFAVFSDGKFQVFRVGAWGERPSVISRALASDQHAPMAFTRDGRLIAVASSRYTIQLFRLPESGEGEPLLMATLAGPDRLPLEILAFSPDSRRLAAATDGQVVQLWNLELLREGLVALNLAGDWPRTPSVSKTD